MCFAGLVTNVCYDTTTCDPSSHLSTPVVPIPTTELYVFQCIPVTADNDSNSMDMFAIIRSQQNKTKEGQDILPYAEDLQDGETEWNGLVDSEVKRDGGEER